jgi:hypothetical protein
MGKNVWLRGEVRFYSLLTGKQITGQKYFGSAAW